MNPYQINIRRIREEMGVSLTELAKRSNVSKSTLSYIELEETDPKLGTLCKVAKALDVHTAALYTDRF